MLPIAPRGTATSAPLPNRENIQSRKRGRGKLDMIKCDQCRSDKQKCQPVLREWPGHKCDRCAEKDLPCSAGRRAERKRRKESSSNRGHGAATCSTDTLSSTHTEETVRQNESNLASSIFLLDFSSLLGKALKRLDELMAEIATLFGQSKEETYYEAGGTQLYDLHDFHNLIHRTALDDLASALEDDNHHSTQSQRSALLRGIKFASMENRMYLINDRPNCPICRKSKLEEKLLSESTRSGNICGEYLIRVDRLEAYRRCCMGKDTFGWEVSDQSKILRLEPKIRSKVVDAAGKLGWQLPETIETSCHLIPEGLMYVKHGEADLRSGNLLDCLGRTDLHLRLDSRHDVDDTSLQTAHDKGTINTLDTLGRSPLHQACQRGMPHIVTRLLQLGADTQQETILGHSPLHYAVAAGDITICKALLTDDRVEPNSTDRFGNTPLFYAVQKGNHMLVKLLLSYEQVNPDGLDRDWSHAPLIKAVNEGREAIVKLLLDRGADPNINRLQYLTFRDDEIEYDGTPLFFAIKHQNISILRLLCESKKISVDPPDFDDRTPLIASASCGFEDGVAYLMSREDVDVNQRNTYGETALHVSVQEGYFQVVEALLQNPSIKVNAKEKYQQETALICAARQGHAEIVQLLLQHRDIEVNLLGRNERTALMEACLEGQLRAVEALLQHPKIDVNLQGSDRSTALMMAVNCRHVVIVELLISDPRVELFLKDIDNHTVLDLAEYCDDEQIVDLLRTEIAQRQAALV